LQHIDFPLPRKHKPALFMAAETAPLTTTAAPTRRMQRRSASRPAACRSIDSNFQELNDDRLSKQAQFCDAMDLREVFATNLRRLRNAKGLSQDDLAYEAKISRSYLSQLEKGVFYASLKIVGKIAGTLEVEPAELLQLPLRRAPRHK
jgi:DNA-binding XRE family transcriptional regulator